jgi:hypothetical protein
LGASLAEELKHRKAIIGIFDEGCMGMYNAIIDDELLNPAGIYKERLSQSALVAKMRTVSERKLKASTTGWLPRACQVCSRQGSATELTLEPGAGAMQDVHCRGAHCARSLAAMQSASSISRD